jgi:hypothetical protein
VNNLLPSPAGSLLPVDESQILGVLRPAWATLATQEDSYVRNCAVVGFMLNTVSERMGHGEFGPWLHRNLFPEVTLAEGKKLDSLPHWRRARRWMEAGRNMAQIAQIGHVSDLTAVELANAVLKGLKGGLSSESAALFDRIVNAVEGKTLAQLTFKFPNLDLAAGGDREWAAFLQAKHPELIVDGKVPKRGKVGAKSKEILAEFSAWLNAKMKPKTPKQKQEAARALLAQVEDVLGAAIRNPLLGVLSPEDFVGAESMTSMWVKRLKDLMAESRK